MKHKENKYERRKRIGVIICALIVAFALLAGVFYPVIVQVAQASSTSTLEQQAKDAKKNKDNAKKQLDEVKQQKANVAEEVLSIDDEINRTENQIEETEAAITAAEQNLVVKEEELRIAEENCMEYDEEFKTRARIMYENGTASYIEVLLGATSFGDFLSRIEMIREIVDYDRAMLDEMIASRNAIKEAKDALALEKQTLEAKREELKVLREELSIRLETKQLLLDQLMADEEEYKKAYDKAEADEKKVQDELARRAAEEAKSGKAPVYTGTGKFLWPCPASSRITSYYGYRIHPVYKTRKFHAGIDVGAGYGSDIIAAESGTVITATYGSGYGKYVVVNHGSGITTLYAHCSSLLVKVGDKVSRGQTIAKVGSTGVSTGNHLHFEVRINGSTTDPLSYVK